jgi:putative transposase
MSRPGEVSVRPLTQEEQQWGERIYHQTIDAMLKTRCQIILLSLQRYSVPQLAALVFSSEDMVADTIHAFNRAGLQGIIPEPKGGRPPKRTAEFLKKLLEVVEGDPRDLGSAFSSWPAGLLAAVLKEPLELEVSESCVRRALHQQSYTIQRPVLTVSSPDPEDEQKCLLIEELQRRAQAGEIDLYYEDEADLALLPGVMRGFSQRGHQRKIETPRHNKKRYGAGLIHWISGKLSWVVSERHPTMFCFARCSLTWPPRRKNQAGSRLVRSMWSWIRIAFTRAKAVQAWLAEHTDEVELVCLPTSSPQLNPVERFWKHLRRRVTHNHPFHTLDRLVEAVQDFFCDMAANPDVIRQVAGLAA